MFEDRTDAGKRLAQRLTSLETQDPIVVGLPRGGVPVAFEVARALGAPLDVVLVRKLGFPFHPELAMGAIGENGVRVLNTALIHETGLSAGDVGAVENSERIELERRAKRYRAHRGRIPLTDRVVVIVDDGVATGSTAKAACEVTRAEGARRIILAVPVAPPEWEDRLSGLADEFISISTPERFASVGQFYRQFTQTSDEEVVDCLNRGSFHATPENDH